MSTTDQPPGTPPPRPPWWRHWPLRDTRPGVIILVLITCIAVGVVMHRGLSAVSFALIPAAAITGREIRARRLARKNDDDPPPG